MTTKERIVLLAEDNGLLKSNLLKKAGIGRSFFDKMNAAVSDKQLAKIFAAFPTVNLEWLVTGDGQMYKPTVVLPPDAVSIDRYTALVRENERLRIELEKMDAAVSVPCGKQKSKRIVSANDK